MKPKTYELLYDTQAQFTQAQGNSGNVTSVTPGVAYVVENDNISFNKPNDNLIIVYNVTNTSSPTKLYHSDTVKTSLNEIIIDKVSIPASAVTNEYQFNSTGSHTVIYRYSSLTGLQQAAFKGCVDIQKVILPKSVVNCAASEVFSGCTKLNDFVTKGNVTSFGVRFFDSCTSLEVFHLPSSVTTIYNSAFIGCSKISKLYIDDLSTYLNINGTQNSRDFPLKYSTVGGDIYVNGVLLTTLEIPSDKTFIPSYCFANCTSLRVVNGFNQVTNVKDNAFRNCKNLSDVGDNSSITTLGRNAFTNCSSLQEFELDNISVIGNETFSGCIALVNVGETSGITAIGDYAFEKCSSLQSFDFDSLTSLGQYAFANSGLLGDVVIPETTLSVTGSTFHNTGIANLTMLATDGTFTTRANTSSFGNGTGTFTVYGNLLRGGASNLRFKNIIVKNDYTVINGAYFLSNSPQLNVFKVNGNFTGKSDSNGLLHTYSSGESQLKFVEITGQCSGRMLYNSAVPGTAIGSDAIFHLAYSAKVTASLTDIFSDNHTNPRTNGGNIARVLKIYVGDGSSEEHDQAILNQYLQDADWAEYASKLDIWYNYHGEYREE